MGKIGAIKKRSMDAAEMQRREVKGGSQGMPRGICFVTLLGGGDEKDIHSHTVWTK